MRYYYDLFIRVLLSFLIRIECFYFIFLPLTGYLVYFLLSLSGFNVVFNGESFLISGYSLDFVEACAAGSAYFLITLLVLLTKGIKFLDRIKIFVLGCLLIYLMNVFRVFILIVLLVKYGWSYFEAVHLIFWRVVSSIYVFLVWIYLSKKFKVKEIPIYSDLKELFGRSLFKKH